jgi:hypothetical protein
MSCTHCRVVGDDRRKGQGRKGYELGGFLLSAPWGTLLGFRFAVLFFSRLMWSRVVKHWRGRVDRARSFAGCGGLRIL